MKMDNQDNDDTLITLTADIVAAHVSNNSVAVNDLPQLISNVHGALAGLTGSGKAADVKLEPKVPIRSSVKPDFIVCLEDGKKLKMLKRHLMTHYQMTPDQYRAKWGLAADYPMVAPNYAEQRRTLAKKIGLGLRFSGEGFRELDALFLLTQENLRMAQTVFMTRDRDMARRLMEQKVTIRNLERQSAQRHLIRLREGQTESRETSSLHLDLLRDLKRINAHAVSVAHPILQDEGLLIESRLRGS